MQKGIANATKVLHIKRVNHEKARVTLLLILSFAFKSCKSVSSAKSVAHWAKQKPGTNDLTRSNALGLAQVSWTAFFWTPQIRMSYHSKAV